MHAISETSYEYVHTVWSPRAKCAVLSLVLASLEIARQVTTHTVSYTVDELGSSKLLVTVT